MSFCDVSCSFLCSIIWKTRVPGKHCYQFPACLGSLNKRELIYIMNFFSKGKWILAFCFPEKQTTSLHVWLCLSRKVTYTAVMLQVWMETVSMKIQSCICAVLIVCSHQQCHGETGREAEVQPRSTHGEKSVRTSLELPNVCLGTGPQELGGANSVTISCLSNRAACTPGPQLWVSKKSSYQFPLRWVLGDRLLCRANRWS